MTAYFSDQRLSTVTLPAAAPILSLLVLRATEPERLVAFYEVLGLVFEKHRHGTGPEHWAAEWGGMVLGCPGGGAR